MSSILKNWRILPSAHAMHSQQIFYFQKIKGSLKIFFFFFSKLQNQLSIRNLEKSMFILICNNREESIIWHRRVRPVSHHDILLLLMYRAELWAPSIIHFNHRRRIETENKAKCRRFGLGVKIECRTRNFGVKL